MIETTPYLLMHGRLPHRDITTVIDFPQEQDEEVDIQKYYNKIEEKTRLQAIKYQESKAKVIKYEVGEQVLLKNRQLPSTIEGIAKKLLLLYKGPYIITKDNQNNTYELTNVKTGQKKGRYNQSEIKKYYK